MKRRQLLTAGVGIGSAIVAGTAPAQVRASASLLGANPIVGSWFGTAVLIDPPLGSFGDLISFHADHTVIESRRYSVHDTPLGSLLETTGHGVWRQQGLNTYEVLFRFILQSAETAAIVGSDTVRLSLVLDTLAGTLAGAFETEVRDTAENLLLVAHGNYTANQIAF
ncbi:MAG: hypothetical protein ACREO8_12945 [Luteimonas sp.]